MDSRQVSTGELLGVFSASSLCVLALIALVLARRRHRGSEEEVEEEEEEEEQEEEVEEGRGRAVLVTGCDSGFGHHLALRLERRGFQVFAGCRWPDGAGGRRLALRGCSSGRLQVLKLDVTDDGDVERAEELVRANLPEKGLWAVVNNAGITDWAETEWSTVDRYIKMADVNLFGCIRTTIAFLPLVRASKGRLVYVSSIFAFFNCLNMGAYSVTKRGMEAFADCLRVEMASFGVKVSIIQPGNFGGATDILKTKATGGDVWETLSAERRRTFNRRYVEQASRYFCTLSRSGFKTVGPVIGALLHAIESPRPKHRYLLVSRADAFFFSCFQLLPTWVTDAVFALSPMYATRKRTLYSQR